MRASTPRGKPGAVLVLVAVFIVVLMVMVAFAVDIGRLYVTRQYLVNSCDASALAGGMALPNQAEATAQASECANANAMTQYQISFPVDGVTAAGPSKIRVDGQKDVQYAFAGILGLRSRTVVAHAIVQRTASVGWVNNQVVPWGMPFFAADGTPYQYGNGVLYTLKVDSQSDNGLPKAGGNFYPLAISRSLGVGGSGGSVYQNDIKWGFDGLVKVGDVVTTEPGNMIGPTKQAVMTDQDSIIQRALEPPWADDTWDDYDYGNPRAVVVPIISPLDNGRMDVTILGFAAFWVDSVQGQEVKGYFLDYTIPEAGGTGPIYGLSTFQLIE